MQTTSCLSVKNGLAVFILSFPPSKEECAGRPTTPSFLGYLNKVLSEGKCLHPSNYINDPLVDHLHKLCKNPESSN